MSGPFSFAWCSELQRMIEPVEAYDWWTETGQKPVIQCPDEQCRTLCIDSRVISVCCNPEEPCRKRSMHFRFGPNHKHRPGCPYEELVECTEHVKAHKKDYIALAPDNNLLKNLQQIDTSFLPDAYLAEYNPRDEIQDIATEAEKWKRKGQRQRESTRIARTIVQQKTSSLTRVVQMAEQLEKINAQDKVPLAIPGRTSATYKSAFFKLTALRNSYYTSYIFYADATVQKVANGYLIDYLYPLRKYHEDFPDIRAITFIDEAANRRYLLNQLEKYALTEQVCCVYSFSTHCLKNNGCPKSESKSCVVIEPKTLDAIVIREDCMR